MRARPVPEIATSVLERARRGDIEAHAELYRILAPPVYTLARRILASTAFAEDVLQETFVEVIRNIRTCRNDAAVVAWVKRIAVNKALMYLRSPWISRRLAHDDLDTVVREEAGGGMDDLIALERALNQLPDTARAVVWLHDVEGYTHGEIAQMMQRTPSFSKSQLARAHDRLRVSLVETAEDNDSELCTPILKTC